MGLGGPKSKFTDQACPNEDCEMYGQAGQGNIVGNGTYQTNNGRIRMYVCRSCGRSYSGRRNTAFFGLSTENEKILPALKMLVKGMSIRGTADVLGTTPNSVSRWLRRAVEHSEEVNAVLLKELKVSKVELDELWTFVQKKGLFNIVWVIVRSRTGMRSESDCWMSTFWQGRSEVTPTKPKRAKKDPASGPRRGRRPLAGQRSIPRARP